MINHGMERVGRNVKGLVVVGTEWRNPSPVEGRRERVNN
jgi:hypothetical protein